MSKISKKLCVMGIKAKESLKQIWKSERGDTNIIAIILILAIVIALAIVFKSQLSALFSRIWSSIFSDVGSVI